MRFMDSIFRGITTFVNKNVTLKFKTKFTSTARDNKNFFLRVLNHSGVAANNGVLLQKYNDESFVSSIFLIDWDTGKLTFYGEISPWYMTLAPQASAPVAAKGRIYFNSSTNKFYKCEDGTNWITF